MNTVLKHVTVIEQDGTVHIHPEIAHIKVQQPGLLMTRKPGFVHWTNCYWNPKEVIVREANCRR